MEESIIQSSINILQPVIEESIVLAGNYCKACNRNTVSSKDLEYCMKYVSMNRVGVHSGSLFPEIYDSESESESESESDEEEEIVEDDQFTRYTGDEEMFKKINQSYDTWTDWVPSCPAEELLKNAINNQYE